MFYVMSLVVTYIISLAAVVGIPVLLTVLVAFRKLRRSYDYLLEVNREQAEENKKLSANGDYLSEISDIHIKLKSYERQIKQIEKAKQSEEGRGRRAGSDGSV